MVTGNPTQTLSPSARVIQQHLVDNPSTRWGGSYEAVPIAS